MQLESCMIVITGATGRTGRPIAEALLAANKAVRAIGRSREALAPLISLGAEPAIGDVADGAFLDRALRGAGAAYVMIPPNPAADDLRAYHARLSEALTSAISRAAVAHVVSLGCLGAHLPRGTGPIVGLYDHEQRLNRLEATHIVHLRPGYFMENLFAQIPEIRMHGTISTAFRADVGFPVVSVKDVAKVAVEYLLKLEFTGHQVRELRGAADVNFNSIVEAIGAVINKADLRYEQLSYADFENMLRKSGSSADAARATAELSRAVNEGLAMDAEGRTSESTTETRLESFAEQFAAIYGASKDSAAEPVAAR